MSNPDGKWLVEWRTRNGYTQEELSLELEVSRQSVLKWEKAAELDRTLILALHALELSPSLQQILARRGKRVVTPE